jgi:hypothetical protein
LVNKDEEKAFKDFTHSQKVGANLLFKYFVNHLIKESYFLTHNLVEVGEFLEEVTVEWPFKLDFLEVYGYIFCVTSKVGGIVHE